MTTSEGLVERRGVNKTESQVRVGRRNRGCRSLIFVYQKIHGCPGVLRARDIRGGVSEPRPVWVKHLQRPSTVPPSLPRYPKRDGQCPVRRGGGLDGVHPPSKGWCVSRNPCPHQEVRRRQWHQVPVRVEDTTID